jgi:hypothetical protein
MPLTAQADPQVLLEKAFGVPSIYQGGLAPLDVHDYEPGPGCKPLRGSARYR